MWEASLWARELVLWPSQCLQNPCGVVFLHALKSHPDLFCLSFPLPFVGGQHPRGSQLHSQPRGPHSQMRRDCPSVQAWPKPRCPARTFFPAPRKIRKGLAHSTHFSSMMVWPLLLVSSMMSFSSSGSKTWGTESLRAPTDKGGKRWGREFTRGDYLLGLSSFLLLFLRGLCWRHLATWHPENSHPTFADEILLTWEIRNGQIHWFNPGGGGHILYSETQCEKATVRTVLN